MRFPEDGHGWIAQDKLFPEGVFRTLMIPSSRVTGVIADPRVHAVTLTGSEPAGRAVAARAAPNAPMNAQSIPRP